MEPAGLEPAPYAVASDRLTKCSLGSQLVRIMREGLAALLGHQEEVLEAHLADVTLPQAGLDGDHIAGDQLAVPRLTEGRILMKLQANAVAKRELKALVRVLPRAGSLSAMPGGLEHVRRPGHAAHVR
jgi:hypothetical protein